MRCVITENNSSSDYDVVRNLRVGFGNVMKEFPATSSCIGTTVAALESDGAAASDYIFLRTASVLLSPSASLWLSQ